MQIVSAREFRSNQGKFLNAAVNGQTLMLKSKYGNFRIVPVYEDDSLTSRISRSLKQAKLIQEGKLPRRTVQDMLDEL